MTDQYRPGAAAGGDGPEPQIDVTLAGRTHTLRPTFGALERIEGATGQGIGVLQMRLQLRETGLRELTRILYEGIVAAEGNAAPEYEAVGAAIVRDGLDTVTPAALDLLTAALHGFARFAADREETGDPGSGSGAGPPAEDDAADPLADSSPGPISSAPPS